MVRVLSGIMIVAMMMVLLLLLEAHLILGNDFDQSTQADCDPVDESDG